MNTKNVGPNSSPFIADSDNVNGDITNNGHPGNAEIVTFDDKPDNSSQLLPSPPRPNPGGDETIREELASDAASNERTPPGKKWNNTHQARHWCLTKNNYTTEDEEKWKEALESGRAKGEVASAIVAKEVGENGTPHFQAYIHFKNLKRQLK
jgi:hypothetical protein